MRRYPVVGSALTGVQEKYTGGDSGILLEPGALVVSRWVLQGGHLVPEQP